MEMQTLLPVRMKKRRNPCIGDSEKQLTSGTGFTKTVVYATAESIIKARKFDSKDQHILATAVNEDLLEFDTYSDELKSNYGRSVLQIIESDGVEAYEELGDDAPTNAYLHAALYDTDVWSAAQTLDVIPDLVVETDDGIESVGGYRIPDLVAAAILKDGTQYENDLREMKPDLDWVLENWRSVGGSRSLSRSYRSAEGAEEKLSEFSDGLADPSTLESCVVNEVERSYTLHQIKDIEESVVQDESNRYVSKCGAEFIDTDDLLMLDVDINRVDKHYRCGNCF